MGLSRAARAVTLSSWIKPSSDTEKAQQDRAERMIRDAVLARASLASADLRIYTKGSYPNSTNVRQDSDVDVVVELQSCFYWKFNPGLTIMPSTPRPAAYSGFWTPSSWRAEILTALRDAFDAPRQRHVMPGRVAINVDAVAQSRPSADVVPSFLFRRYESTDLANAEVGSCVWGTDGKQIVNWPEHQLKNGQAKNRDTPRYKNYVRALKNAENVLAEAGLIEPLPSYFMECLIYNVPDDVLSAGDLVLGFGETLTWLFGKIESGEAATAWVEPNRMKWLFKGHQKWTPAQARQLVVHTWNYLGYGD